jgi:hypothetical protein
MELFRNREGTPAFSCSILRLLLLEKPVLAVRSQPMVAKFQSFRKMLEF